MEAPDRLSGRRACSDSGSAAGAAGPALEVRNLVKRFEGITAVDDVWFAVPAGAFMSLLGPSGSGKTTVLRLLGGFELPDRGSIMVDGSEISRLPPYRRDIGVVFQRYALFPHITVAENIGFALKQRRVPKPARRQRVEEALDMVGLPGYGERHPGQLSGGQQQRVALARALVFKPRILVMDEPLAALDKRLRERMQQEIRQLQKRLRITTVYVTHDQTEAFVMSDLVAVMNHGKLEQIGPPRTLYEKPQTEFVAAFVGDSNLFRGSIVPSPPAEGEMLLNDGSIVHCPWQGSAPESATLLVRPEKLRIDRAEPDSRRFNTLRGRVLDAIFLGDSIEYIVSAAGHEVIVREPNRAGAAHVRPGADVLLSWAIEDTVVLR
ncbi:MAG: ABC transporter ATP-binding protein [Betaproteobacteria bacterium]|nr:MAG: ABC transporter ATP-binding protein [Betaproteobacteria bacterium]